jgi:Protein involved in biosynthesis of mitomycin antibiotics/polyketide fumonisin
MTLSAAAAERDDDNDEHSDNDSLTSADEALLEMLGFTSWKGGKQDQVFAILQESEEKDGDVYINNDHDCPSVVFDHKYSCCHDHNDSDPAASTSSQVNGSSSSRPPVACNDHSKNFFDGIIQKHNLSTAYHMESCCQFPKECSISQKLMRRLTDELLYGATKYPSDRSYETIQFITTKNGKEGTFSPVLQKRREITRFENFVNGHKEWNDLCNGYLAKLISAVCGEEMVLFKEKLNLKPPGGTGFAPHLDSPSLRIALGAQGPCNFVTVMVAIDDMTEKNGCLRLWKGAWNEYNHVTLMKPEEGGDPDAGGRAGAIHPDCVQDDKFESIVCKGGDIVAFNGWVPHRSSANASLFSRRAVF